MLRNLICVWLCIALSNVVFSDEIAINPNPYSPANVLVIAQDLHNDLGSLLPLWSIIPFVGILLSIAFCPLFVPHFWHRHYVKISFGWGLSMAIPFIISYQMEAVHALLHIVLLDYIPFIILLWALYTISGGILFRGTLIGTPWLNTGILFIGVVLASWMGTTGAAMLLIRPFLRANQHRQNRTFMVCFFIFLVANIGGSLTPLGDPPLFLGFLHGVPFFWTFNLLPHMLLTASIVLVIYFAIDWYFYQNEKPASLPKEKIPLSIEGWHNFFILGGVVLAILLSGLVDLGTASIFGILRSYQDLLRDGLLIVFGILSLKTTTLAIRQDNEFNWEPIKEVAYLFIGIFITMVPCLAILKAGAQGHAAGLFQIVKEPYQYFWITGLLSAFLDNAPTYLTFFGTSLGQFYPGMEESAAVHKLIVENSTTLQAISAGAVFFGAVTYIGNAPNFMVRSIAEKSGTPMPSFFGYFFLYGCPTFFPIFLLITLIFF